MENEKFTKYVTLIASMSVDCLKEGITEETYLANLQVMVPQMKDLLKPEQPEAGQDRDNMLHAI